MAYVAYLLFGSLGCIHSFHWSERAASIVFQLLRILFGLAVLAVLASGLFMFLHVVPVVIWGPALLLVFLLMFFFPPLEDWICDPIMGMIDRILGIRDGRT